MESTIDIIYVPKTVLFVWETASLLGVSAYSVYKLIHSKILTAYKDAGSNTWRIPVWSIKAYMREHMK